MFPTPKSGRSCAALALAVTLMSGVAGCGDDGGDPGWEAVHRQLPGALLSVWGTSETDVWLVGGDARDGSGPMVLHYDGATWQRKQTGQTQGDLWWVFGFAGGPVYMGGAGGVILRYDSDQFTVMTTPGTNTVFGIWGSSPSDLWAVGGASDGTGGFVWRSDGGDWTEEPTAPADLTTRGAVWKVFGRSADDVWLVGSNSIALRWNGSELSDSTTGVGSSLFTVHADAERFVAVGGLASGVIVENDGSGWVTATPDPPPFSLAGVCLGADGTGYAVGLYATIYARDDTGWHEQTLGFGLPGNFHAIWVDPSGGAWAVGGQTSSFPLTDGMLIYSGKRVPVGDIQ